MKRSEFIKNLLAMPGNDPQVIFTNDGEEMDYNGMVPDFNVTTDDEGNPIQVPAFVEIKLS